MKSAVRVSPRAARAAVLRAQGLAGAVGSPTVASVLERSGFLRTLGGVEVYLALRARIPGLTRAATEEAVARGEASVVPTVRGCMYLVARRDVPDSVRLAASLTAARDAREHEKAGIAKGELSKVARAVEKALAGGPLSTDALRKTLPKGAFRSLGELGKKVGISSTLPPALRLLEFEGRIVRAPETGRLDSERYVWRPADGAKEKGGSDAALHARFAERFFRWAALSTPKDFAEWCGIPQRDAKAALEKLPLVPVEVEGIEGAFVALEESLPLFEMRADEAVAFLPFEDNVIALHGGASLLVDAEHHALEMPSWGSGSKTGLAAARHLALRTFVADGRIAGVWEYDPDAKEVVTAPFAKLPAAVAKRVSAAAKETAAFLAGELGHGRCFSLDTDDELRSRSSKVRELR